MCSERRGRIRRIAAAGAVALLLAAPSGARVLLSVDKALKLAFPDCRIERESVFLTDSEMIAVAERAGMPRERAIVVRYRAFKHDEPAGTAYFDTHRVRTLDETVMVVVEPEGTIGRIEVISFAEPPDYLPRQGWYRQFDGERLDDDLQLDRDISAVTGATLTAKATTTAARGVLALHEVIEKRSRG